MKKKGQPLKVEKKIRYRLVWNKARRLNKRGEGLIEIEMQQGRRRKYLSTGMYATPAEWGEGDLCGCSREMMKRRALLRKMKMEVEDIEVGLMLQGRVPTVGTIKEMAKEGVRSDMPIGDLIALMMEDEKRCETTRSNYRTLMNDLEKFRRRTYIVDVDYDYVKAYERWLKGRVRQNTLTGRMRLLRSVMNEARRREIYCEEPFKLYKIGQMEPRKGHLTKAQLWRLWEMPLTGREEVARDLYLIGCVTGLRYSDIRTLRQSDIDSGGWIKKRRKRLA